MNTPKRDRAVIVACLNRATSAVEIDMLRKELRRWDIWFDLASSQRQFTQPVKKEVHRQGKFDGIVLVK